MSSQSVILRIGLAPRSTTLMFGRNGTFAVARPTAGDKTSLKRRNHRRGTRLRGGIERLAVFGCHAGCGDRSTQRPPHREGFCPSGNGKCAVRCSPTDPTGSGRPMISRVSSGVGPPARRRPRVPAPIPHTQHRHRLRMRGRMENPISQAQDQREDEGSLDLRAIHAASATKGSAFLISAKQHRILPINAVRRGLGRSGRRPLLLLISCRRR